VSDGELLEGGKSLQPSWISLASIIVVTTIDSKRIESSRFELQGVGGVVCTGEIAVVFPVCQLKHLEIRRRTVKIVRECRKG
jgi:hypothetical protein